MSEPIPFKWEEISVSLSGMLWTHRAKVFGGWIVRENGTEETSLCFVPDPNHEWKIK